MSETQQRTLYQARLDARFYEIFHERNARLFRHVRGAFSFVSLIAGTAAFTLLLKQNEWVAAGAGLAIAAVAILSHVIGPTEKALLHAQAAAGYARLLADTAGKDIALADFDARLRAVGAAHSVHSIYALRQAAFNDNVLEAGHDDCVVPLSAWQRFVAALA